MDFSYSEEQQQIIDLAGQILADQATPERMRALERGDGHRFDAELWKAMAEAGLLGIAVPAEHGGSGLGFLEVAAIVEQVGAHTAPVPYLETIVLDALPIAELGSTTQKEAWLPRVVRGDAILTAALVEPEGEVLRPKTLAARDGDGWKLEGVKICVPAGQLAGCVLVPAKTSRGEIGLFLVDPRAAGVTIDDLHTTSGQPEARLELRGVRAGAGDVLGRPSAGAAMLEWIRERATAALCAMALGVCREALRLTADYTKTREQFGVAIATFQAVGQRAADAYIDVEGIRLTSWQASWRLAAGLPASAQIAVAKLWAAEAGQRVVHTAQHLHGGIGVDRDYPLHRHFLYAKQLELTLGGATEQLRRLGRMIAE